MASTSTRRGVNMNNIQCIIDIKTTFISVMVTGSLVTTARILAATSTLLRSVDLGGNCQSECSIDRSELLVFFISTADLLIVVTCAGDPRSSNRRGEAHRRLGQHHGLQP